MAEIPLTQGRVAIVDDGDFDRLSDFHWGVNANGAVIRTAGMASKGTFRTYYLHREVAGASPTCRVIHLNGDRLDNRRTNLKVVERLVERGFISRTEIPLTRGYVALVDEADFDQLARWDWFAVNSGGSACVHACRYDRSSGKRRVIWMHREILGAQPGQIIDHANRNGVDNRRANLRFCTASQNSANSEGRRSVSGFRGVKAPCRGKRWRAQIRVSGRLLTVGWGDTPEEAARLYDRAAREHYGPFATLNFPDRVAA